MNFNTVPNCRPDIFNRSLSSRRKRGKKCHFYVAFTHAGLPLGTEQNTCIKVFLCGQVRTGFSLLRIKRKLASSSNMKFEFQNLKSRFRKIRFRSWSSKPLSVNAAIVLCRILCKDIWRIGKLLIKIGRLLFVSILKHKLNISNLNNSSI